MSGRRHSGSLRALCAAIAGDTISQRQGGLKGVLDKYLHTAADVSHFGGGVDLVQDQPGVVAAEVMFHVVLQLKPGHNFLPLSPDGGFEAAGGCPGVEPGVVYVPQILQQHDIKCHQKN